MKVQSIQEFAAEKGFVQFIPTVRANTQGYPFITFIDADNKAENIYFSKAGASTVTVGESVDLRKFQIGETTNGTGEVRMKLITNSERVSLSAMFA